jgi:antitoxin ChpS
MAYIVVPRKVGGSVMVELPPALLDTVELAAGQRVAVSVEDGRIVVEPARRPRYTLAQLLARCDPAAPRPEEDTAWHDLPPVGDELP